MRNSREHHFHSNNKISNFSFAAQKHDVISTPEEQRKFSTQLKALPPQSDQEDFTVFIEIIKITWIKQIKQKETL